MSISKKRIIKSLESLADDLRELMKRQYPNGYEASINRIKNAKNEPIFVFPLETDDTIYLIKVPATKNSDGEYDVDSGSRQEFDKQEGDGDVDAGSDGDRDDGDGDGYDGEGGRPKMPRKPATILILIIDQIIILINRRTPSIRVVFVLF